MKEFTKEQMEEIDAMTDEHVAKFFDNFYGDTVKPPFEFKHKALCYCSEHYSTAIRDDMVTWWMDLNDEKDMEDIAEIRNALEPMAFRKHGVNRLASTALKPIYRKLHNISAYRAEKEE